jgi:hypothetical protein
LPTIVESAESSPAAAKECAHSIRKFLTKENFDKPYVQYNSIMLIRILADNPGKTFTRNIDAKFVQTIKELLRVGRDPSVKQILMETLTTFQKDKPNDEGLAPLNEMWKKEYERMIKIHVSYIYYLIFAALLLTFSQGPGGPRALNTPPVDPHNQNYFSRNHNSRKLPNPHELASRIEEARTSAKLLSQVVQSTPPSELLANDLIREFADRCQSASRSIQAYMVAENPSPDIDTMETLIETNEQLGAAMSQHQRAVLAARKATGLDGGRPPLGNPEAGPRTASWVASQQPGPNGFSPPPGPPPNLSKAAPRKAAKGPQIPPPGDFAPTFSDDEDERDPFADPDQPVKVKREIDAGRPFSENGGEQSERLGIEPYHPGFRETESYVGRQNESAGNTTMHAATSSFDEDLVSPDSANSPRNTGYGVQAAAAKAPVYRY